MMGLGSGTPGRSRGTRTRRAAGRIVQRTGVSSTSASPSTPTGIWAASASMTTSRPARLMSPLERLPRNRPAAWAALWTVTANIPRVPRSSRARRPSPAMSPIPYWLLDTRTAWGPSTVTFSALATSRGPLWPTSRSGSWSGRAALVVAVGRALHHGGIGPEGGVVDERAAGDEPQVDPEFNPVGERVQAPGGIFAVQPEVEGEVVAGAGRDDQQRHIMLGGDGGHQRLGPVTACHPEQVGPVGHRLAGQLAHVHDLRPLEQGDGGAQGLGLVLEAEPSHLPAARARVHDQIGPLGRRGVVLAHLLGYGVATSAARPAATATDQQPQRHQHDPQQPLLV